MGKMFASFLFSFCILFIGSDTASKDIIIDVPFSVELVNMLEEKLGNIADKLQDISEKIDSSFMLQSMSEDIGYLKRQQDQIKYDFEINAYETLVERNKTREILRENNEKLNNLQAVTENLQTETKSNISALDDNLSRQLMNIEEKSKEYESVANSSLKTLSIELDLLKNGSFLLSTQSAFSKVPGDEERESLWVYSIVGFSSQLNVDQQGAIQAIGPPDVYPYYGHSGNVWAQRDQYFTDDQYITVKFAKRLYIEEINIYETFNAGGVKEIKSLNSSGQWDTLWETSKAEQITSSRIFSPTLQRMDYPTDTLDIIVDCSIARNFVEIDAVQIIGKRPDDSKNVEETEEKLRPCTEVSMWASSVRGFSSQRSSANQAASKILWQPDVYPYYGPFSNAWMQTEGHVTSNQYIKVSFPEHVFIDLVKIYETYNAGAVKEIESLSPSGHWESIWNTTQVQLIGSSRIFSPKIKIKDYPSDSLRIAVDCSLARNFVGIDAVGITGARPNFTIVQDVQLWVYSIRGFSSQYSKGRWAASQVIGSPNVYPAYSDNDRSWTQAKNRFNAYQYLTVGYSEHLFIKEVQIYETFNAGAVKEIKSLNPSGQWETLWNTTQVQHIRASRIFSPTIKIKDYVTDSLHITVDCTAANSYVYIDAIKIVGTRQIDG